MLNAKGFIGPVGDDIPSLIPLLIGLVIFFSTFTVTFSAFDSRNSDFSYDLTVMGISRILQSSSYLTGFEEFQLHCREIGEVNLNFAAIISEEKTSAVFGSGENSAGVKIFSNSEGKFYCSNLAVSSPESISDFISLQEAADLKVVSRVFPIAVEDEKIVKPLHLYVVAWK